MEWISVEAGLPNQDQIVLAISRWKGYFIVYRHLQSWRYYYTGEGCEVVDICQQELTHWMELPKPPATSMPESQSHLLSRAADLVEKLVASNEEAQKIANKLLENHRELFIRLSGK